MINIGDKFGRWEVLSEGAPYHFPSTNHTALRFDCKCTCGKLKLVRASTLLSGQSTSCGCYAREQASVRVLTHGLSKHKLYGVWHGMIRRCTDGTRKDYKHYGGRGISVCARWEGDAGLVNFILDMEPTFVEGLELERKDVNGNYEPSNCTWVTRQIQVINRRPMNNSFDAHFVTHDGETLCLSQWGEKLGIHNKVLSDRIAKLKWSTEKALTTKVRAKRIYVSFNNLRFKLEDVVKHPPNLYVRAKAKEITVLQYLADIFYGGAVVSFESDKIEYNVNAITNRTESLKSNWFHKDFLKQVDIKKIFNNEN